MFKIADGRTEFYQWDLDRKIIVEDKTIDEVHFCNRTDSCSLVVKVREEDGVYIADVPNVLLQTAWNINVYGYCEGNYTKQSAVFKVAARTKPEDYFYSPIGAGNVKGYKVQLITSWDKDTATFGLSEAGEDKLEVGDVVNIDGDINYPNCAVIKSVTDTTVQLSKNPTSFLDETGSTLINPLAEPHYIYVVGKPNTGTYKLGVNLMIAGSENTAIGDNAITMGSENISNGSHATTIGNKNTAVPFSVAIGKDNEALGMVSTVIGAENTSSGRFTHIFGMGCKASGIDATAIGTRTKATGEGALAIGYEATASGDKCVAIGQGIATGDVSLALKGKASGFSALSASREGEASGSDAVALGFKTTSTGNATTAIGSQTKAKGSYSLAGGLGSSANAACSFALGKAVRANSEGQLVVGTFNADTYQSLFIIGNGTSESNRSNAFIVRTNGDVYANGLKLATENLVYNKTAMLGYATGEMAFASNNSVASGRHSAAFNTSTAEGEASTSFGASTTATGWASVATGTGTTASGRLSFVGGQGSVARGECNFAYGRAVRTNANTVGQFAVGRHNAGVQDAMFIVGNGENDSALSNALVVMKNGTATIGAMGTSDNSVVTKKYTDDLIAQLTARIEALGG